MDVSKKQEYRELMDQIIDRSDTFSMKWSDGQDVLPFWVADMEIQCAPAIVKAIKNRAASPIYGYTDIPEEWAKAYIRWFEKEYDWTIREEQLVYSNGIICSLSSMVRRFSVPHEKVVVLTPVYPIFFNSIINNGREPLEVELHYEDGVYSIDFEKLEEAFQDPQASLMILCNPHNPTGNLWSKDELVRIADLAAEHGILIISDEVHCDLTRPGHGYTPFASVSQAAKENSLVLLSPSKAFNTAGIHSAALYCANPILRHRAWRAINTDEVGEPNVFSIQTAIAAYTECDEWISVLRAYLFENRDIAARFLEERFPDLQVVKSDALYLQWIDVSRICDDAKKLVDYLEEHALIRISAGDDFKGNGYQFIRFNLACPRGFLMEGLKRLESGLKDWLSDKKNQNR